MKKWVKAKVEVKPVNQAQRENPRERTVITLLLRKANDSEGSKLAILLTVPETLNRNKYPRFETS